MTGLAQDAVKKFIIDDAKKQLDKARSEAKAGENIIEVKFSDLVSEKWFAVDEACHIQLYIDIVVSSLDLCQFGLHKGSDAFEVSFQDLFLHLPTDYYEFLHYTLATDLTNVYLKQIFARRIDLSDETEEENDDKRQNYAARIRADTQLISEVFNLQDLTRPLVMVSSLIKLDRELLNFEMPKFYGEFPKLTVVDSIVRTHFTRMLP